jgi:hypothetical protein
MSAFDNRFNDLYDELDSVVLDVEKTVNLLVDIMSALDKLGDDVDKFIASLEEENG